MYLQANPGTDKSRLILGAAAGLEYLHSKDVVHGDLKVQNVLIDKQGNACICDFGISRLLGSRGFTTSSVGTAPYMAPELFFVIDAIDQIKTTPKTTKESDVYSFGLLALEILTSECLKARPVRPIITSLAHSKLRPVRSDYESSVDLSLWIILNECWVTEPSSRPTIKSLLPKLRQGFIEQKSSITGKILDDSWGERPFGYSSPSSQPLNSQMENEPASGTKPYTCPHCGKSFNRPSSLKIHLASHTAPRPYKCPFPGCDRSFAVESNMRRHMRTHSQ